MVNINWFEVVSVFVGCVAALTYVFYQLDKRAYYSALGYKDADEGQHHLTIYQPPNIGGLPNTVHDERYPSEPTEPTATGDVSGYEDGVNYFEYVKSSGVDNLPFHLALCMVTANDNLHRGTEKGSYACGVLDALLEFFQENTEDGHAVLDNLPQARQQVDEMNTPSSAGRVKHLLIKASSNSGAHGCEPAISYMIGRINKEQENDHN